MYNPEPEIVPPATPSKTVQVTEVSVAPVTVAANCWLPFAGRLTEEGEIVIVTAANALGGLTKRSIARRNQPACKQRLRFFPE
jgi:hypothetical protein